MSIDRAKASPMIRNTLEPGSENGAVLITPNGRIGFQHRGVEMGMTSCTFTEVKSVTLPHWVLLTRKGN